MFLAQFWSIWSRERWIRYGLDRLDKFSNRIILYLVRFLKLYFELETFQLLVGMLCILSPCQHYVGLPFSHLFWVVTTRY